MKIVNGGKAVYIVLFFLILGSVLLAESSLFEVVSIDRNYTEIEFNLDEYEFIPVMVDGVEYQRLYHPQSGFILYEGLPELLSFSVLVSIPETGTVNLENYEVIETSIINNIKIFPSQGFDLEIDEERGFIKDENFYATNVLYPEKNITVSEPAIMRYVRLVSVSVTPFIYNPYTEQLTINDKIRFRVVYNQATSGVNEITNPLQKVSRDFENLFQDAIINYGQFRNPNLAYQDRSLLVIYNAGLPVNLVNQFTEWKKNKGFLVTAVTTGTTGTTSSAITNYIQNAYNTWANPPEFVTIIGDRGGNVSVPMWAISHPETYANANVPVQTDNSYVTVAGNDDLPDIFVGRISVLSEYQFTSYLNKLTNYEINPYMETTAWYERNLLVADPSTSGISTITTNRYVKELMERHNPNYTYNEVYSSPFANQMQNAINSGVSFFNFRGLEDIGGWWYPTESQVFNGYMLHNGVVITCRTMTYSNNLQIDVLFRAGTPTTAKGSITGIGMSHVTRTAFNNSLTSGIFYGVFVNEMRTMGEALARGKLNLWQSFINSHWAAEGRRHIRMVNMFGDASMSIWVETPKALNVNHPTQLPPGSNSVSFTATAANGTPVEDAWVTIRQANDVILSTGYTDSNGTITHLFSPESAGSITVTATKPNYIPHHGSISLNGTPAVSFNDVTINGNMIAGNTVNFVIHAKNHRTQQVNGVSGTLTSESEYINITNNTANFGNIGAGAIALSQTNYNVTLAANTPSGHIARFHLTLTDSSNNNWTSIFDLTVQNSNLIPTSVTISDGGNGILEPNEQAQLIISLQNNSLIGIQGVTGTLSGASSGLSITDNSAVFGNIAAGQTVSSTNHFAVSTGSFVIPGMTYELDLHLQNNLGFSQHETITLEIGNITVNSPLGPDAYGYWCYDSGDTAYDEAPVYSWQEIVPNLGGQGTNTNLTSDYNNNQSTVVRNLPFTFTFYGVDYNQISICANGWMSFGSTIISEQRNWRIPGPLGPKAMVAAFWDNLRISGTNSGVFTYYNANNNTFIIQWNNMQNVMGNAQETFQVILYNPEHYFTRTGDGPIKIQYKTFNNVNNGANSPSGVGNWGNYSTIGIDDHTCKVGLEYTFNNRYPTAARPLGHETAIYFTTGSSVAIIAVDDFSFTDDNNNIPESGETVNINLSLTNIGNVDSEGINAVLTTNDPYITIVGNNSADFGDIASEQSSLVNNAYTVQIAHNTPHLHEVLFNLNITDTDNQNWIESFLMTVVASDITIHAVNVTDNNNNIPEYGEIVSLTVQLTNSGELAAENITALLSSNDPFVTLLNTESAYGNIVPTQIVNGSVPFSVEFADNIPNLHRVNFNLEINGDGGLNWNRNFYIDVNAPVLSSMYPYVHDPAPGGNNNGFIDPGENFVIYLPLKNTGGAKTQAIDIDISCNNPEVTITDYTSHLNPLPAEQTYYPSVYLIVSDNVSTGNELVFQYTYQTGEYSFAGEFSMYVGGAINVQVGSGTAETTGALASPINIYYRSLRGQMVYTAAELLAAGAIPGMPIVQFGFFVVESPVNPLPNFTLRMKHTTANNAASHDNGPFTTVYNPPSYIPTAGGWDLITLTTPFVWNGTDNILVDSAFSQVSSWSSTGIVRINNITNGFRYVRNDAASQINVETTATSPDRPQAIFIMGSDPDAGANKPQNLTAEFAITHISLNWDAPANRGTSSLSVRDKAATRRSNRDELDSRNPEGYFIYRNGVRLNITPLVNTTFDDYTIDGSATYYYFVTAVYNGEETLPSNVATTEILSVSEPIFTPNDGIYYEPIQVTMESDTEDALIYYTLDGSEPTTQSSLYQNPFEINYHTQVKAKAFKEGLFASSTAIAEYSILYSPDNLSGVGSTSSALLTWEAPWSPANLNVANFGEATIRNSKTRLTDNSRNTYQNSRNLLGYNVYRATGTGEFYQINTAPVASLTYYDQGLEQAVYNYNVKALYTYGESLASNTVSVRVGNVVANPVFNPEPGNYASSVSVTLSCTTDNATIYYTLNGNNPTISSPIFTGTPIVVDEATTIKAMAVRTGWLNSDIVVGLYTIGVSVEDEITTPLITELRNAYPNPFNPTTTLSFSLKNAGFVSLEVYNISGKIVKSLVSEELPSGEYKFTWDGTDNRKNRVGSGIYFYRMLTADYQAVKKIVLLK